ncbi:MAG TPA: F0F1 ATP synthase subunit gamma [Candidatus Saccharimonadales bacterium]|jgi:F-type H+-transporting ATPase subunit gamma
MQRPQELEKDLDQVGTIKDLTNIFEGIASLRIAQIKNQVQQSQHFFHALWKIYTQLRVDSIFRFGRTQGEDKVIDKELFIVITAEGGLGGDIDQKLIEWLMTHYDKAKNDILVIGHHGAIQLAQRGVSVKKYFKLPTKDRNINVRPITEEVQKYKSSIVYYQTYVSLMVQDVKRISLQTAVQQQGGQQAQAEDATKEDEDIGLISEQNYIFEPSTFAVVDHLERSMLSIMVSQLILESKLAQYASRFRAMSAANDKAKDSYDELKLDYNRAKRAMADEQLKSIVAGLKLAARS